MHYWYTREAWPLTPIEFWKLFVPHTPVNLGRHQNGNGRHKEAERWSRARATDLRHTYDVEFFTHPPHTMHALATIPNMRAHTHTHTSTSFSCAFFSSEYRNIVCQSFHKRKHGDPNLEA